jgi:tRNA (guanine-N7-)-methyltransferase
LVDNLLPRLRLPAEAAALKSPHTLFSGSIDALWLEIGFGGGEHVSAQAKAHPHVGYLASEVFIEGLAKCLSDIEEMALSNVRLWDEDARALIDLLPDGCLDRVFILFPDPWPKKKHHKRRLIQPDFLDALARVMKPGAHLRFATDVRSYADEALARILAHGAFDWTASKADDWRQPPADHVRTRYETKNLGDIAPVFLDFACHRGPVG